MNPTGATEPTAVERAHVRNRRGQGGRLREDIIDAAVALLDETGDERSITLRSVARKVGIAAPSIYPHFSDQPRIMLAVVQREFAGLEAYLRKAVEEAGDEPRDRLLAICRGYLEFARKYPQRYRTMFGGLWMPPLGEGHSLSEEDTLTLGQGAIQLLVDALAECVAAGQSEITDPPLDAVVLWMSLHGLAHQRAVSRGFPWPEHSIADAMVTRIARLTEA
ncbi:TetR/AcrR family transcriptional regulator [Kribbella italica]|uniref:AcrR family transcriptional regulator n=1 Tax=Kribbella italica TaxID=1540520 RepID=A0A7W9J5S9_9ACTN|nr:TetR/AcrR family transcriptional regulator [Kribbella italica]MBB5835914.1 AcrR family transcriptional regulator [Kribbella italica]